MNIFKKTPHEEPEALFKKKYSAFQNLLNKNNQVLEIMADMEEKLSGEFLFDRHYIESNISALKAGVKEIIDNLNNISKNKYTALYDRFNHIVLSIEKALSRKKEVPVGDLVIPFESIDREMLDFVGGKNANLGEIRNRLKMSTPAGFAITAYGYKRFMEHNGLVEKIKRRLPDLQIDNIEQLNRISREIQYMVISAEIPEDLDIAISEAIEKLKIKRLLTSNLAVRSSALHEDGDFSFAGQYSTFLNVPPELVKSKYKEVMASLFTPQAIFYYKSKGFEEYEMIMSVGVMTMVDAITGGVMYSRNPNSPLDDNIIISAIRGLGKCAVEGVVTPDTYIVSRPHPYTIIEKRIPVQETMLICKPDGGLEEILVPEEMQGRPCLSDEQIKELTDYAVKIEEHYKSPQDIEWAIDKEGRIYILQTRPLRVTQRGGHQQTIPRKIKGYNILLDRGVIACKGIGYGKAFVLKKEEDLKDFPEGAVLVARHTSTKFVTVMNRASAIITDVGGITGHMASLAREFQVPAILDTEIATEIIKQGQEITVDAFNCNVYEGRVEELLRFSKRHEPFKNTELFKTLEKALKWIVPLNLVDPDDPNFKPEFCETLHDITRFCHEAGMNEMFRIKETPSGHFGEARRLLAGIPLSVSLIDLGGGIKQEEKRLLPEHIISVPFNAFFKGLISMKWPEPKPFDTKGFLAMMAHTATIPEQELRKTGEASFAFISKEYMNFSLRLGYHLSTVEAYAGENINDNYIRFFFKGGGAAMDRRLRRIRLITDILKRLDFRVRVIEDIVDAVITKYRQKAIEERLQILGKLTVYTKQLDMVMYNDAITDLYIEEFVNEYLKN
ncbi:MAG: PEP-utilizing enzyme [Thermodesulfovibrionales bacterium]|nr:PEP-utilizing enzyme [Thermodesulfovibrionales bacterium]